MRTREMLKTFFTFLTILVGLFALYLAIKIVAEVPEVYKNKKYLTAYEMRKYLGIEKLKKKWFKKVYKQVLKSGKRKANKISIFCEDIPKGMENDWSKYIYEQFTGLGYSVTLISETWVLISW